MPAISVLLPVYNTNPKHLRQAIDSVLAQSFADFELLICNDNSSFAHVEDIVLGYADSRIRYMRSDVSLGISGVRNLLLDEAKGKYLAVMDHDDIALPERFAKQYKVMEADADIGVCGTAKRKFGHFWKNKKVIYPEHDTQIRTEMFFRCAMHHPTTMIRASVLRDNNIRYNTEYVSCNDRLLFRDISEHAKLYNIPEVLYDYRMHKGMTSKIKRAAIACEQDRLRQSYLDKMNVHLSPVDMNVFNNVIANGRVKIRSIDTLKQVRTVLEAICAQNAVSGYLPADELRQISYTYLKKRCKRAFFCGVFNAWSVLK